MIFQILKVGQLGANCYILTSRIDNSSIIIDPGDDADFISDFLTRNDLNPLKIFATHGHFDHLMAAFELSVAHHIPFGLNSKDIFLIDRMEESIKYFIGKNMVSRKPEISLNLNSQSEIKLGDERIRILETPGHTPGSISFYCQTSNFCISGDTIFAEGGRGRTDFVYSDINLLNKSIFKLLHLPPETVILPGHGDKTSVLGETKYYIN
jgi:hydroxyacylglutathione hydrolase